MEVFFLISIVLIFVAAFLFAERILAAMMGPQRAEAKRTERRLKLLKEIGDGGRAKSIIKQARGTKENAFDLWLAEQRGFRDFARALKGSGSKLTLSQVIFYSVLLGAGTFAVLFLLERALFGAIAGSIALIILPLKISIDYKKRLGKFEEGLIEALDLIIRALRAGQPFSESLLLVAQELEGPVAEEFGIMFAEVNYGVSIKEAFDHMIERVPSVTLKAMAVAVVLQKETGGNLAEVLTNVANVLRSRFKFYRKVRTLSAEGRLSALILIAVPFVLFGMISLSSPGYVAPLVETEQGHRLIIISAIMMVIGILWVKRIVTIDV